MRPLGTLPVERTTSMRRQFYRLTEESFGCMRSSRKLAGHKSCVNSLEWTKEGRWLVSGGDDGAIFLWDIYDDLSCKPRLSLDAPRGNVLALGVSASNVSLFCGTTEGLVRYDLATCISLSKPRNDTWIGSLYHPSSDTIRDISPHPTNDNLVLTASDDGFARLHDMRSPDNRHRAAGEIRLNTECTAIKYHPGVEPLFVLCDKSGNALLHDSRMAFRDRTYTSGYSPHVLPVPHVLQYVTRVTKPNIHFLAKPEPSSLVFDTTGSKFAITFMGHYPTIYSPNDPYPLAYCTGRTLPDGSPIPSGERTYSNSATMKHGSFGGSDYYSAGSDDFRSYIWKIPPKSYLEEHRRPMTSSDWLNQTDADQTAPLFAFSQYSDEVPMIPVELSKPSCLVGGHHSIINSSIFHPQLPFLATAGIESFIRLHRPFSSPTSAASQAETRTDLGWTSGYLPPRSLPATVTRSERTRILLALLGERTAFDEMDDIGAEDAGSIAMFDEILRQEGDIDIFLRPASDDEEDEDEDDDPEELESLRSGRHCLRCEEDSESGSDSESSSDEFDL